MVRLLLGAIAAAIVGLAVWSAVPSTPPLAAPSLGSAPAPTPPPAREAARPPSPPAVAADGDLEAKITACLGAQREVASARAARGGPAPAGQPSDAAVVARGCAPLYKQAGCRDAMIRFDEPPIERRSIAVLQACAHAYCGELPAPKPSACANPDSVPQDEQQWTAWNDLRLAILTHDLGGAAAQRVLSERPR